MAKCRKNFFFIVICFSLVKATMNAARVCKLRNGVNKTPQFLLFSIAKGGTKTIVHLSIEEGRAFEAFTMVNSGMKIFFYSSAQ